MIEGKTPAAGGLFDGGDKQVVTLTRPAPDGSTVAVTLERAGGATTPTLPILEHDDGLGLARCRPAPRG